MMCHILFIISIFSFATTYSMFENEINLADKYLLASYAQQQQKNNETLVPLYAAHAVRVPAHSQYSHRLATWGLFGGIAVLMYFLYQNGDQLAVLTHDISPQSAGCSTSLVLEDLEVHWNLSTHLARLTTIVLAEEPKPGSVLKNEHEKLLDNLRHLQKRYALESGAITPSYHIEKSGKNSGERLSIIMGPDCKVRLFHHCDY